MAATAGTNTTEVPAGPDTYDKYVAPQCILRLYVLDKSSSWKSTIPLFAFIYLLRIFFDIVVLIQGSANPRPPNSKENLTKESKKRV